jgi:hypothetical protein
MLLLLLLLCSPLLRLSTFICILERSSSLFCIASYKTSAREKESAAVAFYRARVLSLSLSLSFHACVIATKDHVQIMRSMLDANLLSPVRCSERGEREKERKFSA